MFGENQKKLEMEELKRFCDSCKTKQDIVEIIKEAQGETIKMACSHKFITLVISDTMTMEEQICMKHFDSSHKLKAKDKTNKAGKSGRPATESFIIDRERRVIIHKVWEKNKNGAMEQVQSEEKPFKEKSI